MNLGQMIRAHAVDAVVAVIAVACGWFLGDQLAKVAALSFAGIVLIRIIGLSQNGKDAKLYLLLLVFDAILFIAAPKLAIFAPVGWAVSIAWVSVVLWVLLSGLSVVLFEAAVIYAKFLIHSVKVIADKEKE